MTMKPGMSVGAAGSLDQSQVGIAANSSTPIGSANGAGKSAHENAFIVFLEYIARVSFIFLTIFFCIGTLGWIFRVLFAPSLGWVEPNLFANAFRPLTISLHGVAGTFLMILGLLQVSARARTWLGKHHKTVGYIFLAVSLAMVGSALGLDPKAPIWGMPWLIPGGGIACLLFGLLGWLAIKRGNLAAHRRWMLRCYAAAWIGFTLRIYFVFFGEVIHLPFEPRYALSAWLATITNIVIVEAFIAIYRTPPKPKRGKDADLLTYSGFSASSRRERSA